MSCSAYKNTRTCRERELYRYFQPSVLPHHAHDISTSEASRPRTPIPRSSEDPILTSFAQLGALRFNAKRSLITLATPGSGHVLAESGRKLSLQADDDDSDPLWYGAGRFDRDPAGMGPTIADLFSQDNPPSHVTIGDLTKDPRFMNKDAVVGDRKLRALACAPLRTPHSNLVIGCYIVVDDKTRCRLEEGERQFLTDIAATVMDYLESGRIKRQQYRSERMVKAIGLFIEGKSSLRDWWLESGHRSQHSALKKRIRDVTSLDKQADLEFGVQESTDYFSRSGLNGLHDNSREVSRPQSPSSGTATSVVASVDHRGDGRPPIPARDTLLSASDITIPPTLTSRSWQDRNSSVTTFDDTLTSGLTPDPEKHGVQTPIVAFDLPPATTPEPNATDIHRELQNAVLSSDVRGVFARASNLIREAIGVDGVIYFDGSVGSFGGDIDSDKMRNPGAFDPEQVDQAVMTSEDDIARRSDTDGEVNKPYLDPASVVKQEKFCNVLGYSTRKRSSLRGHPLAEERRTFPESVLRKLFKRYPHGKVYNFDEEGSFSASDSDNPGNASGTEQATLGRPSSETYSRNRLSREAEAAAILAALPGARSVFWFPLWDQSRERWYAGSLVWSTSATRTLCPVEDITYLAAFGNSTMAEISRLSAQVLSKMKTDFISSISHELRSPLHGVLASVEFLQDTQLTEIQADMVSNIQASGKVLLDTINHVLDFSKVNRRTKTNNNKRREKMRRKQRKFGRRTSIDDGSEDKGDICILSEEVIESIYAGQSVSKKALGLAGHLRKISVDEAKPLVIVMDIRYRPNWTFEIESGAWRRVIMNLFSNAMKYTKVGFVSISLEVEEDIASHGKKLRSNLVLKIKDSGKGISQEFLKHQLYKPFTQEDSLATGAGLGLSIVKAIVQELGGKIDFTSEPGSGTEATVRIPLTERQPQVDSLKLVGEVKERVKGLKFKLEGFDRYPDITEAPTGILSAEAEAAMLLKSSVQTTLVDWFAMDVHPALPDTRADVVILMESGFGDKSLEKVLQSIHISGSPAAGKSIAIVLTSSYHSGPKIDVLGNFRIFYIQQPCGPHKIGKVLHQAFCSPETSSIAYSLSPLKEEDLKPFLPPTSSTLNRTSPLPTSAGLDFATLLPSISASPQEAGKPTLQDPADIPLPADEDIKTTDGDNTAPIPAALPAFPGTPPEGLRVLLVEDNEINLKLLIATMRKLKLEHSTATNGLEALDAYKDCDGRFDVIFMDISMPIMSGIESTRHIRRFEKEKGLEPVALIALTGAANPSTRQEAFTSGVDLFLTKPVPMKALRGMLDDLKREGRGAFAGC